MFGLKRVVDSELDATAGYHDNILTFHLLRLRCRIQQASQIALVRLLRMFLVRVS